MRGMSLAAMDMAGLAVGNICAVKHASLQSILCSRTGHCRPAGQKPRKPKFFLHHFLHLCFRILKEMVGAIPINTRTHKYKISVLVGEYMLPDRHPLQMPARRKIYLKPF